VFLIISSYIKQIRSASSFQHGRYSKLELKFGLIVPEDRSKTKFEAQSHVNLMSTLMSICRTQDWLGWGWSLVDSSSTKSFALSSTLILISLTESDEFLNNSVPCLTYFTVTLTKQFITSAQKYSLILFPKKKSNFKNQNNHIVCIYPQNHPHTKWSSFYFVSRNLNFYLNWAPTPSNSFHASFQIDANFRIMSIFFLLFHASTSDIT
jgi:hypothetical protein